MVVGQNETESSQENSTFTSRSGSSNGIFAEYHHKDHLGNVRVAFTDRNDDQFVTLLGTANDIEVTQQLDYYPFGLQQQGDGLFHSQQEPENRYRYNGIEHSEETGLDMAMFRSYDPALGRWAQVDPIYKFHESGYAAMANNPISYTDPLGLDSIPAGTILPTVTVIDEGCGNCPLPTPTFTPESNSSSSSGSSSEQGSAESDSRSSSGKSAARLRIVPAELGRGLSIFEKLNGGIVGNTRYSWSGEVIGPAPIMGLPPDIGQGAGWKALTRVPKGQRWTKWTEWIKGNRKGQGPGSWANPSKETYLVEEFRKIGTSLPKGIRSNSGVGKAPEFLRPKKTPRQERVDAVIQVVEVLSKLFGG